jgi:hypothetical protein
MILNIWRLRKREREREKRKLGVGVVRDTRVLGGRNKIGGYEGSQAVPISHSGRGEACMRDLFIFNF